MIEQAVKTGTPKGVVLADCDYGNKTVFRDTLARLGLKYAVEIQSTTKVRLVGTRDVPGERIAVGDIGRRIRKKFRKVTWRDGTNRVLHSRFARLRVIVDREDNIEREPEWLLIEWPEGEASATKFVLLTLPSSTSCKQLVHTFKERWRIERSYEDVKGELGFDHYEGRSFVGWHHHVTTVLVCYAFLVAETVRSFSPLDPPGKVTVTRSKVPPERHYEDSLTTLRTTLVREILVRWLPRCPACLRAHPRDLSPH
jgi:SRSO17 transposase